MPALSTPSEQSWKSSPHHKVLQKVANSKMQKCSITSYFQNCQFVSKATILCNLVQKGRLLVIGQIAKMVMKVAWKVLWNMNLMSRHKVLYNGVTEEKSTFFWTRLSKLVDFKINSHFLHQLVMGQTAGMVMNMCNNSHRTIYIVSSAPLVIGPEHLKAHLKSMLLHIGLLYQEHIHSENKGDRTMLQ